VAVPVARPPYFSSQRHSPAKVPAPVVSQKRPREHHICWFQSEVAVGRPKRSLQSLLSTALTSALRRGTKCCAQRAPAGVTYAGHLSTHLPRFGLFGQQSLTRMHVLPRPQSPDFLHLFLLVGDPVEGCCTHTCPPPFFRAQRQPEFADLQVVTSLAGVPSVQ
jgi:hypothetical protein